MPGARRDGGHLRGDGRTGGADESLAVVRETTTVGRKLREKSIGFGSNAAMGCGGKAEASDRLGVSAGGSRQGVWETKGADSVGESCRPAVRNQKDVGKK